MNSTKNLLAAIFIVLLVAIPQAKAQSIDSTTTNPLLARNMIFLTGETTIPLYAALIGIGYERFITNAISAKTTILISSITQVEVDADYSFWAGNARLYGGLNLAAWIYPYQGYEPEFWAGIKVGLQSYPRNGGFSFGIYGLQWFVGYIPDSKVQIASFSNLNRFSPPFVGFTIGYTF